MLKSINWTRWSKRATGLAVLGLSVLFLLTGYGWLVSGLKAHQVRVQLEQWQTQPERLNVQSWQRVQQQIDSALAKTPFASGELYQLKGQVHQIALEQRFGQAQQHFDAAMQAFRSQLSLNPTYPQAYLNLLELKALVRQLDAEWLTLAQQFTQYNRYFAHFDYPFAQVMLPYFQGLDRPLQHYVWRSIALNPHPYQQQQLKMQLRELGQLQAFCLAYPQLEVAQGVSESFFCTRSSVLNNSGE